MDPEEEQDGATQGKEDSRGTAINAENGATRDTSAGPKGKEEEQEEQDQGQEEQGQEPADKERTRRNKGEEDKQEEEEARQGQQGIMTAIATSAVSGATRRSTATRKRK